MKAIAIVFIGMFPIWALSQTKDDTVQIEKIVRLQMKIEDDYFDRPYVLSRSSTPYDTTKSYYQSDSVYNNYPLGKHLKWTQFDLYSKYGSVESDTTTYKEASLFISTPVFNANKTKCRIVVNTHTEWSGDVSYYYYRKRLNRWKLVDRSLISLTH